MKHMVEPLLSRTLYYAEELSKIPNAPFLHGPMLRRILTYLNDFGVTSYLESKDLERGVYALDDFCLYVRIKRGKTSRPILVDSHLDHPGFVLDGNGRALAMGSVGFKRINNLLQEGPIDLRVFEPSGEFMAMGKLTGLEIFTATVETPVTVPANSHGLWNVPDFEMQDDKLLMHAADNMIVTDLMLALIEQAVGDPDSMPDLDVTFVFTFLEEVFEASATALAMRGSTPFDQIDDSWLIIVLESMEPVPLRVDSGHFEDQDLQKLRLADDSQAVTVRTEESDSKSQHHALYDSLALPHPNAEDGVVIKVNDFDGVYGYLFADQPNLAETLLLQAAELMQVTYQHTIFGGACNGTAYSLFPTSSHIVTLSVPNPYKHNLHLDGSIVPEEIKIRDLEAAAAIMLYVLQNSDQKIPQEYPDSLSQRLKSTNLVPNDPVIKKLRAERGTIAWSTRWRLRNQRYFGETLTENARFKLRGLVSRIREPLYRSIS